MADSLMAPLVSLLLPSGSVIKLEALDPVTGAAVSGVTVSRVVISGVTPTADDDELIALGEPLYVPGSLAG